MLTGMLPQLMDWDWVVSWGSLGSYIFSSVGNSISDTNTMLHTYEWHDVLCYVAYIHYFN